MSEHCGSSSPPRARRIVEMTLRWPDGTMDGISIETPVGGRITSDQRHWIEHAIAVVLQEYHVSVVHRREIYGVDPRGQAGAKGVPN